MAESQWTSTDDFAGTLVNQTNLAIKGTIGIAAMAVIEGMLGNTAMQSNYTVRLPLPPTGTHPTAADSGPTSRTSSKTTSPRS